MTTAAPAPGDDTNLLMLALRQDGDHSVLLLTLLDRVGATDAKYDAEQLANLVRDCKSNMASLATALRSNKPPEPPPNAPAEDMSTKALAGDVGEADSASDCSLARAAAVQPSADTSIAPKKLGLPVVSAGVHRGEPPQAGVPKTGGHSMDTPQPNHVAPLGVALAAPSPRVPRLGEALNLGDVLSDLRDCAEPRNDGETGTALREVGDLGDYPVNDKYR